MHQRGVDTKREAEGDHSTVPAPADGSAPGGPGNPGPKPPKKEPKPKPAPKQKTDEQLARAVSRWAN